MSLRFVAALSACVLAMGCSDSTDPGEGGLSQTGIDGGGDGTAGTGDGDTGDGDTTDTGDVVGDTTGTDAKPTCGDGVCEGDETPDSCPLDCQGAGPVCGDGSCDPGENPNNCPQDCQGGGGGAGECLQKNCGDELKACQGNPKCVELRKCSGGCQGNQQCLQKCSQEAGEEAVETFQGMIQCGQENNCFGGQPGQCGNGNCDPGENPNNCPQDCSDDGGDPFECLSENCGEQLEKCFNNQQCAQTLGCVQDCAGDENCSAKCLNDANGPAAEMLGQIQQCGETNGCFGNSQGKCGDGVCDGPETSDTCPEDCQPDPIDSCLEDNCTDLYYECVEWEPCAKLGECLDACETNQCFNQCFFGAPDGAGFLMEELLNCGDQHNCFDGGGGGNDSCEGKCGELSETAPCQCDEDCMAFGDCCDDYVELCDEGGGGNPDVFECLVGECNPGMCLNFPGCAAAFECMTGCESDGCLKECIDDAPNGAKNVLNNVAECGLNHECFPFDGGGGPECGNGECEDGENFENCEEDCEPPEPASCEGKCGEFDVQNWPCQCDSQCAQFNDCCEDYKQLCTDEPPVNEVHQCLVDGCNVGNCLNFNGCSNAFACLTECESQGCLDECVDDGPNPAKGLLGEVAACGVEIGCYEFGGVEPPDPDVPPETCIFNKCEDQVEQCTQSIECVLGLQCIKECEGDEGCAEECAKAQDGDSLFIVLECAFEKKCFG